MHIVGRVMPHIINSGSCDHDDCSNVSLTQGHVIMMTQPQYIYQRVIDKTKGLAFQATSPISKQKYVI